MNKIMMRLKRKKTVKTTIVVALTLVMGLITVESTLAMIIGSSHDFSGSDWNITIEICISCHTPHTAWINLVPLWNHEATVATFTTYSSPSIDAQMNQPSGLSKACLSCHDGTVAPTASGLGGTIRDDLLSNDRLECTSCHDVHNGGQSLYNLIHKSNVKSALCLTCHLK